jgi:DNA (cytosine-5)-methyltransferase 1
MSTYRELSLFSGNGGGLIATTIFLNIRTVGYVEFNPYCQKVISQRIKDGHLHEAPIFSNIKTFISEGYAKEYKGMVDIITGGFPCQPFSSAGLHKAQEDERNMWPATQEVIRIIQPRFLFLENVENLLHFQYVQHIFGGLAKIGYNAQWTVLSAKDIGAFFKRDRLWIFGERIDISRDNSI